MTLGLLTAKKSSLSYRTQIIDRYISWELIYFGTTSFENDANRPFNFQQHSLGHIYLFRRSTQIIGLVPHSI